MLGNLRIRKKGYVLLPEVLLRLKRGGTAVRLQIAGSGSDAAVKSLSAGLEERDGRIGGGIGRWLRGLLGCCCGRHEPEYENSGQGSRAPATA